MGGGQSSSNVYQTHKYLESLNLDYVLGTGGYSTVLHGIDSQTRQNIAVKRINISSVLKQEKKDCVDTLNTILMELEAFKRIGTRSQSSLPIIPSHSSFSNSNSQDKDKDSDNKNNKNNKYEDDKYEDNKDCDEDEEDNKDKNIIKDKNNIKNKNNNNIINKNNNNNINNFNNFNHNFIVTLHSAFRHQSCCYLVMDCMSGGDLRHFLKINGPLNEQSVIYIVSCVGSALFHCHSRGVLHRDIKPENIGLDVLGRPYLMDFGISVVSSLENPIPLCESSSGTLPYLAPEVLSSGNCHSYQADYWSLGVMAYELLFNCRPFSRHCPLHSIQFVSNEYGRMWMELKKSLHSSNSNSHSSFSTQSQSYVNSNSNLISNHSSSNYSPSNHNSNNNSHHSSFSLMSTPHIDFENINNQCKMKIENGEEYQIPFPNLSISLNEDGSCPPCLILSFPDPKRHRQSIHSSQSPLSPSSQHCTSDVISPSSKSQQHSQQQVKTQKVTFSCSISEECQSLLRGLIDVRIPVRLGNLTRYSEFSEHICFMKYGYLPSISSSHSSNSSNPNSIPLSQIPSPLLQYSFDVLTMSNFNSTPLVVESEPFSVDQMNKLPPKLQQKLSQYHYQNPSRQYLSRKSMNNGVNRVNTHFYLGNNSNSNLNLNLGFKLNSNQNYLDTSESIMSSRLTGRTIIKECT